MLSKLETLLHLPTQRIRNFVRRWESEIVRAFVTGRGMTLAADGSLVLLDALRPTGTYFGKLINSPHRAPDADWSINKNNIVDQGIMKALGVMFYTDAKIANWYLTLCNGAASPPDSLTATNFASTMGEITSLTEGFSNTTRPQFTPGAPAANIISNSASQAVFHIVCATSIHVTSSGCISDNVRGGTTGTLWSAALWPAPRDLFNGEDFALGYQTSLTD